MTAVATGTRSSCPSMARAYQLDAVNATLAYAFRDLGGTSSILRTEDGGRSWQSIHMAVT